jgi:hypothetical protein
VAERDEAVERIRRSVAVTAAAGTARIRFVPRRIEGRSVESIIGDRSSARTAGVFRLAKRAVKRGLAVVPPSSSESGFAAGQIDFVQRRSVYNAGTVWKLSAPGRHFFGQPDEWTAGEHEGIVLEEPFWLLEVINATVAAVDDGSDWVRGTECRRYAATADFRLALAGADRPLATPWSSDQLDLARLAVDVWLDEPGRIRRAELHGAGSLTTLELFDFGEPLPIELPDSSNTGAEPRSSD